VDEERDQPDTACAKRKRDDDAHGAASRAERTIERYYDHRLEEEGSITNKKRRSEGTGGVTKLDSAVSGRHSGFEVVEFQLVCPIASFDIRRKQGDALKAEVEKQPVKCRIPPFELKGSGVGVITVFTPLVAHSGSILPSGYGASSAHAGARSEWPTGGRSRKEHPLTSRDDGIWRVCRPGHGRGHIHLPRRLSLQQPRRARILLSHGHIRAKAMYARLNFAPDVARLRRL
jgi:hypothetical protein